MLRLHFRRESARLSGGTVQERDNRSTIKSETTMIKINPSAVFREEFDNSAILFNPDNGDIFSLNATGKVIWKALAEGCADEAAVLRKLAEACDAPLPEGAENDVKEFIAALKEKGFVADA